MAASERIEERSEPQRPAPSAFARGGWGFPVLSALLLSALAFAHRGLLTLRPRTNVAAPLSSEVENWFFEPSDTSPALVLVLIGWLLYRRRGRLMRTAGASGPVWLTALLFGAGLATFLWALRTDARELQALTVLFEILAAANAFGGRAALRIAVVPAVFLVFALPLPSPLLNAVVWKFQIWTAEYASFLVGLLGMSAFVSGDQIFMSDQTFQIIESCSGMRTIETLTMLTVLMVDLFERRGRHAVSLLLLAPFVAFGINGFRALGLMLNPHSDVAAIHNLQGILMLLAGVLVMYFIDGQLERVFVQARPPRPPRRPHARDAQPDLVPWGVATAGVLVLVGLSLSVTRWELPVRRPGDPAPIIETALAGRPAREAKTDRVFLGQTQLLQVLHREYMHEGRPVSLFVGTGTRTSRYRSFHAPKTAYPGSGWIEEAREVVQTSDGRWREELRLRRGTRRVLVHHWREGTASLGVEALRTALALDVSPLRRESSPIVVRISTPLSRGSDARLAGRARLESFAAQIRPALKQIASPRGA